MAGGKRVGSRAEGPTRGAPRVVLLLLAVGITFAVVAWGYLVFAAIDFGSEARHDDKTSAWALLAIAALGAMTCLFLAFMLAVRLARALGLVAGGEARPERDRNRPKGGKRAAR